MVGVESLGFDWVELMLKTADHPVFGWWRREMDMDMPDLKLN